MKPINNNPSVRRMLRNTISALCLLLILSSGIQSVYAQASLEIEPTRSSLCSGGAIECCYHITYTSPAGLPGTKSLDLILSNLGCFNIACLGGPNPPITISQLGVTTMVTTSGNTLTLTFNVPLQPGTHVDFVLCPNGACTEDAVANITFTWISKDPNGAANAGSTASATFNHCISGATDCRGCNQTVIYGAWGSCFSIVCFKNKSTSTTTGPIHVEFDPHLPPCVGSTCYSTTTIDPPTGWTKTNVTLDGSGNLISFDLNGGGIHLEGCEDLCINIPKCHRGTYTVKMTDPTHPFDCGSYPSASFKDVGEIKNNTMDNLDLQNYPNPLTSKTDFKTVIPFLMPEGGEAKVSIFDVAGKIVSTDEQTFSGAGKHFFYFTGSQLPSGRYFYTIESPIGVAIVQKSLLIVK